MSEKEFKFPAKRIIEFNEDDFRTNDQITSFSESLITDKDWLDFAKNALTFTDGNVIYRYAEEYPIVVYKCSDKVKLMPSNRLNSFIEKIKQQINHNGNSIAAHHTKLQNEYEAMLHN